MSLQARFNRLKVEASEAEGSVDLGDVRDKAAVLSHDYPAIRSTHRLHRVISRAYDDMLIKYKDLQAAKIELRRAERAVANSLQFSKYQIEAESLHE